MLGEGTEDVSKDYCKSVVKEVFEKVGGDYENPTKEKLEEVVGHLAKFSEAFRNPEIVKKHAGEISGLIGRLE